MCRRSTALWLLSGCSLLAGVAAGADPLYESANAKLDSIVNGKVAPGAQVLFPVVILSLGLMVGVVVIGLFFPLVDLIRSLA